MQYYFSTDGAAQQGPLEKEQLVAAGVTRDSMIWREGMGQWMRAGELAEIDDLFAGGEVAVSPPYGQPSTFTAYQQPGYAAPAVGQATSGMAIASLVLSIVGLVTCCWLIPSILAIVFGHMAKADIRRSGRAGEGMATAGLVMGYIGIAVGLIVAVCYIIGIASSVSNTSSTINGPTGIRSSPFTTTHR